MFSRLSASQVRQVRIPSSGQRRSVSLVIPYSISNLLIRQAPQPGPKELMLAMTKYLHPRRAHSRNFGEVYETHVVNHRVWFQPNRIIIGEFDDFKKVEEYCTVGRIPDIMIDHRGEAVDSRHWLDERNMLHPHLPAEAHQLANNFFTHHRLNGDGKQSFLPLSRPQIYCYLPRVSGMVKGLSFLKDNDGVCFEYDWKNIAHIEEFRYDLYIGIKVLEALEELRPAPSAE